MNEEQIIQEIIRYCRSDYDIPQSIEIAELDLFSLDYEGNELTFESLLNILHDFKDANKGLNIVCNFERGGYEDYSCVDIKSYREETTKEVAARISEYRLAAIGRLNDKRAQYERMKKEFEGDSK